MMLECKREECGKVWNYKGQNKVYATCPDCKRSTKISESITKEVKK